MNMELTISHPISQGESRTTISFYLRRLLFFTYKNLFKVIRSYGTK